MGCPKLANGLAEQITRCGEGRPGVRVIEAGVAGFTAPRVVDVTSIAGGILRVVPDLQMMTATSERACAPLWPYGPGRCSAMSWRLRG